MFYNDFFDRPVDVDALSARSARRFTNDRGALGSAAAVVFHIPSLHRPSRWRPPRKRPGQLWAAWSMESEVNYPVLADCRFMGRFDVTITYRRDATIWCPYLPAGDEFEAALSAPVPDKTAGAPVALFQSATIDRSGRNRLIGDLMERMEVHSYGRFRNNRQVGTADRGPETKRAVIAAYKFCLAFENSIAPDYVTEKFFEPLLAGTVPVYLGAPNVADFAPGPKSYIDATAFAGPDDLAAYLKRLDTDDAAYGEYLTWRRHGLSPAFRRLLARVPVTPFSHLSDLVAARQAARI